MVQVSVLIVSKKTLNLVYHRYDFKVACTPKRVGWKYSMTTNGDPYVPMAGG